MATSNPEENAEHEVTLRRQTVRFTLDLDVEQHQFIKYLSAANGVKAAVIMRAMLYRLEVDEDLANQIIDDIFAE